MMRTRLVILGVLIVLGVSVLLIVRSRSRSKTAPPANTVTARPDTSPAAHPAATAVPAVPLQEQLAADIRKNGVAPDRAKLLFSMVVGPLPGVSVPAEGRAIHQISMARSRSATFTRS